MKSILIVRLSAIGDIVMASPLPGALRRAYPEAHIAWLVQAEAAELLTHNTVLDEVIVWPRARWRGLWRQRRWRALGREARDFVALLRARRFDVAIDAQGLLKSGVWVWLSGARRRIGLGSGEGSQWLMTQVIAKPKNDPRIGSEYLHLLEQLAVDPAPFAMEVALSPEDLAFQQSIVAKHGLAAGYAVVCPFTTRPQKHWREEAWSALVTRLNNESGRPVVMLGGPGDQDAAQRLIGLAERQRLIDMTGKTRLREAAALIRGASLLVGVDTGLTHMGIAFNTPSIMLFGATCPYLDTGRENTVILYKALACSPCRRNPTCGGAYPCMTQITVDDVMAGARRLLAGRTHAIGKSGRRATPGAMRSGD